MASRKKTLKQFQRSGQAPWLALIFEGEAGAERNGNVRSVGWSFQGRTFSSVQSLSCVRLYVTPWTAACQASLSITNSQTLPKLMSIESVMPSNHLILCRPLLLPPSVFPSSRVITNESVQTQGKTYPGSCIWGPSEYAKRRFRFLCLLFIIRNGAVWEKQWAFHCQIHGAHLFLPGWPKNFIHTLYRLHI